MLGQISEQTATAKPKISFLSRRNDDESDDEIDFSGL